GTLLSLLDAVYPPTICSICDMNLSTPTEADTHFQTIHKSKRHYLCLHPHCDQVFRSRANLRFHIANSH
ncbi:uncharacterized protein BX664DRAFT_246085, partial [Halteromyces radiatus]|uniref:uncharacterized protein n=1 Tax=Halteromyces radiatus TaxID=101107 RepID=UPI00221E5340